MKKLLFTLAILFGCSQVSFADEMDNDIKTNKSKATAASTQAKAGSELDKETPDQSHFWRHRAGWGHSHCFYPSYSFNSCYYPSFSYTSCYSPCYGGGYYGGGFGGGFYGGGLSFGYSRFGGGWGGRCW